MRGSAAGQERAEAMAVGADTARALLECHGRTFAALFPFVERRALDAMRAAGRAA